MPRPTPRERAHRGEQRPLFVPDAGTSKDLRDFRPLAGRTCAICDGREPAIEIGERCIEAMIETKIETELERMIDEGRLDDRLAKVLGRRLARASLPAMEEDHDLVDHTPVPYSGADH